MIKQIGNVLLLSILLGKYLQSEYSELRRDHSPSEFQILSGTSLWQKVEKKSEERGIKNQIQRYFLNVLNLCPHDVDHPRLFMSDVCERPGRHDDPDGDGVSAGLELLGDQAEEADQETEHNSGSLGKFNYIKNSNGKKGERPWGLG